MKLLAISLLLTIFALSGTTNKVLTPEQIKNRNILLGKDKGTLADFLLEAEVMIQIQEKEIDALETAFTNQSLEYGAFKREVKLTTKINDLKARERRVRQTGVVAVVSAVLTLAGVILFRGATTDWKFNLTTSGLSPGHTFKF